MRAHSAVERPAIMKIRNGTRRFVTLAALAAAVPAAAAPTMESPIDGLHYLVGSWKCTYRAQAAQLAYNAKYMYDRESRTLREVASWQGGGDEQLLGYDAQRGGWTAVVIDDHGNATVMRATGKNPNHFVYRSIYPDAGIAETFDRSSATEYTLHATMRSGGKTIASVDTCVRAAP